MSEIKTVALTLGGRERHLRYDVNALIDLGEELGLNLLTKEGWEQLTGKAVAADSDQGKAFLAESPLAKLDKNGNFFIPVSPSYKRVRAILWAGLRHEEESLTVRQVGAWLDPANMGDAISAYQEAWSVSEGTGQQDPKDQA